MIPVNPLANLEQINKTTHNYRSNYNADSEFRIVHDKFLPEKLKETFSYTATNFVHM